MACRQSTLVIVGVAICLWIAISTVLQSSQVILLQDESSSSSSPVSVQAQAQAQVNPQSSSQGEEQRAVVFFNIYIPREEEHKQSRRSLNIVREQLSVLRSSLAYAQKSPPPVYFTVLGDSNNVTREVVQQICGPNCHPLALYQEEGDEMVTLQLLHEYCTKHPNASITYIHNKGSFHPTVQNRWFRDMLTKAVFSDECQKAFISSDQFTDQSCNICGARFSPLPHFHMPGNMWTAQCVYVEKLIPPRDFVEKMEDMLSFVMQHEDPLVPRPTQGQYDLGWCVGRRRFASEHWIGSHPSIRPCDVFPGKYKYGYPKKNLEPWSPELHVGGPRFALEKFKLEKLQSSANNNNNNNNNKTSQWLCGPARLVEFQYLYGQLPPSSSFVWSYYNRTVNEQCLEPLDPGKNYSQLFAEILPPPTN